LCYLGRIRTRTGHPRDGVRLARSALRLARETDNVQMQIEIRNDLGLALTASGQPEEATEHFRRALKLALESEDPFEQGRGAGRPDRPPPRALGDVTARVLM
jgi:Flp pilus assembly protein TadD